MDVEVTGVIEDPPPTTHMTYRMIVSFETGNNGNLEAWSNNSFLTYFKLPREYPPADLENKLPHLLESRMGEGSSESSRLHVQPVLDIHLHSHLDAELQANGDLRYVYLLTVIALLILIIACFNFTNLSTARAQQRAVEIGTRKAAGADRRELLLQFLTESVFFSFAALVFAVAIAFLATPLVSTLLQRSLDFASLASAGTVIAALLITLFVGLAAGAYPAVLLSSLRPSAVLRGDGGRKSWKSTLRSSLVVGQFVIAIGLILGVLVVRGQLDLLQNERLGFNEERLIVLPSTPEMRDNFDDIRNQLLMHSGIEAEARLGQAFTIVSGLAILIACLGLFGLATLITQRRLKEIGIRKAFGASIPSLLGRLTSDFLSLVLIAAVLAVQLSYVLLNRWLDQFASRIQLGAGVFLAATALVTLLAAATMGYQVVRAATSNPVKCLRQE